ncbi:MAG: radical SAM protein [Lachnospiraceae bacterium]|nr:radical SAM protein [Lachnospiraceae bacterium]
MNLKTDLARIWLTRSLKPFVFKNEYDENLRFHGIDELGLYVHIPFCKHVCDFCPYCKTRYDQDTCDRYIDALISEIHIVGRQSPNKRKVTSLYFGGGTPALAIDRLGEVILEIRKHFDITEGIGIELHPDNVKVSVLRKLKELGFTKICIGIQSFLPKYQEILGRKTVDKEALAYVLEQVPFETVSMDFIFALPDQTFEDLKSDIDDAFALGANHVAVYPFIDFTFTHSGVEGAANKEKRKLLDQLTMYCKEKGYKRDSIWTFSNSEDAHYSSMTRDNILGNGVSATTLLKDQFKINTFDIDAYCKRVDEKKLPTAMTLRFTQRQRMVYYLFWTAYSTNVDPERFRKFFGVPLKKKYGFELLVARFLGFCKLQNGIYKMTLKGAFYYPYFENFYTLAYIDKMWSVLRKEAFPKKIELK